MPNEFPIVTRVCRCPGGGPRADDDHDSDCPFFNPPTPDSLDLFSEFNFNDAAENANDITDDDNVDLLGDDESKDNLSSPNLLWLYENFDANTGNNNNDNNLNNPPQAAASPPSLTANYEKGKLVTMGDATTNLPSRTGTLFAHLNIN